MIRNSIIVGASLTNDCVDIRDKTRLSEIYADKAFPSVAPTGADGEPSGRTGISFPYFSLSNKMPKHAWTSIGAYPASMLLTMS